MLLRTPLAAALCVSLVASMAVAQTAVVGATKDNTLYEEVTTGLSNGGGQYFFAGTNGLGENRRGLLAFDVAGAVPAGSTITGVTLHLTMSRTISGGATVGLRRVTADWNEGTTDALGEEGAGAIAQPGDVTWLHRASATIPWNTPGGDFLGTVSASTSVSAEGAYQWSSPGMVADVQMWLDQPAMNFGWALLGNEGAIRTAKRFNTREHPVASTRPVLVVQYVPAPGVSAAVMCGLACTGLRRRR